MNYYLKDLILLHLMYDTFDGGLYNISSRLYDMDKEEDCYEEEELIKCFAGRVISILRDLRRRESLAKYYFEHYKAPILDIVANLHLLSSFLNLFDYLDDEVAEAYPYEKSYQLANIKVSSGDKSLYVMDIKKIDEKTFKNNLEQIYEEFKAGLCMALSTLYLEALFIHRYFDITFLFLYEFINGVKNFRNAVMNDEVKDFLIDFLKEVFKDKTKEHSRDYMIEVETYTTDNNLYSEQVAIRLYNTEYNIRVETLHYYKREEEGKVYEEFSDYEISANVIIYDYLMSEIPTIKEMINQNADERRKFNRLLFFLNLLNTIASGYSKSI